ncbi:MAG: CAP domain-containing protein [Yoonia sp.]|nr:CAP domain-containing protein [Yoonia sp.]
MNRRKILTGLTLMGLAACSANTSARIGADGLPLPQVYKIGPNDTGDIQFRMLDSVNTLRQAAGVPAVELDAQLNAAAATHSRDMSAQNRPWLFGSDGSSPLDRAKRAGFQGQVIGENISESYETELETLAAWMRQADTRGVVLDPKARRMGIAWFQEPAGKLWWTLSMGSDAVIGVSVVQTTSTSADTQVPFQLGNF